MGTTVELCTARPRLVADGAAPPRSPRRVRLVCGGRGGEGGGEDKKGQKGFPPFLRLSPACPKKVDEGQSLSPNPSRAGADLMRCRCGVDGDHGGPPLSALSPPCSRRSSFFWGPPSSSAPPGSLVEQQAAPPARGSLESNDLPCENAGRLAGDHVPRQGLRREERAALFGSRGRGRCEW